MNHWQTMQLALEYKKGSILYLAHTLSDEEAKLSVEEIDAALAFVREMRQQPTVPDDVAETMRIYLTERRKELFVPGRKWDDATKRVLARIDTALDWLDTNALA